MISKTRKRGSDFNSPIEILFEKTPRLKILKPSVDTRLYALGVQTKHHRSRTSIGLLRFLCFVQAFFRVFLCIVEAVHFLS